MIENVMNTMGGVGLYGVISITLFFAVFVGVLAWTVGLKQPYLNSMRELPLEGSAGPEPEADVTAKPGESHE